MSKRDRDNSINTGENLGVLNQAIENGSYGYRDMTGRAEVIEYYQDRYGAKNWKSELVNALAQQTGKSRNTVSREFQYDKRLGTERYKSGKETKATKEKYAELAKKLPKKKVLRNVKGKPASIKFRGKLKISGRWYDRKNKTPIKLTGPQMAKIINGQDYGPIFDKWGIGAGTLEGLEIDDLSIDFGQ
jgi:hypothetical protein